MMGNTVEGIRRAYDLAAAGYAADMWDEISRKPFDRIMLDWFAAQVPAGERVLEIGCGPGEVSGYLRGRGADCLGTDLSPAMIAQARRYWPDIDFEVQDFLDLPYAAESFAAAVAFYAIVNLDVAQIRTALAGIRRVLKPGGHFLFTFHIFETVEWDVAAEFYGQAGNRLDFHYFRVAELKTLVEELGWSIVDIVVRQPYPGVEHPSQRAYFSLVKPDGAGTSPAGA
jgi:ubiquinone/menaquinone biosynthesis C-methylase UbiE